MNNEIENIISHIQPEEDSEKMLNYIEELEQQNKELIETLDIAIDILSDCNYNFILGKEVVEKYK